MAPAEQAEDITKSLQHALHHLGRVAEQLRVFSQETANWVALATNEIAMVVTKAAVEYDLTIHDVSPPRPESTSPLVAATIQPRPSYTPAFPPGLGYDTPETRAHIARGDRVIGGGFGLYPPLIPPGAPQVPNFVPSRPRAMMTPRQAWADAALLGSLSNRELPARRAVARQSGSSSGAGNLVNRQRLAPIAESETAGPSTLPATQGTASIATPISLPCTRPIPGVPSADSSAPTKQPEVLVRPKVHGAGMTWAKVAATPVPEPTGADVMAGSSSHSTQATRPINAVGPSNPDLNEPPAEQQRVVWVRGCARNTTLRFISEKIHEGAIMSILFDVDPLDSTNANSRAACVIFHQAANALEFIEANRNTAAVTGSCRYGPGYSIEPGLAWPADDEIRAMDAHPHQRRRLTVVGKGLFNRVPRKRFEADIKKIAGECNVELIWLYNHGNATVVLASVKVARVVHERLVARARSGGPYGGAVITFTSDPCESTMVLCTQLRDWE